MSDLTVSEARLYIETHLAAYIAKQYDTTPEYAANKAVERVDALLLAYRSALAGETNVVEAAAKAIFQRFQKEATEQGEHDTVDLWEVNEDLYSDAARTALAPLLVQLQDKEERIKALEGELSHHLHCRTCAEDGCSSCPNCNAEKFLPEEVS